MASRLLRDELRRAATGRPTAVAIGKFDGVHSGHQELLRFLRERADGRGLDTAVVTFHPNPITVIRPGTVAPYLMSLDERIERLKELGIDAVAPVTFTSELAQTSAEEFARALRDDLHMELLVAGPDLALGRNREGTPERMRELGRQLDFDVEFARLLTSEGGKVGSAAVREALARGDIETAARLLGRPFSLSGPVVHGAMRGRTIGFPTANIAIGADRVLPNYGVYATRAHLRGDGYDSVTNIGRRPTFDAGAPSIETHILDFDEDIYGQELRIDLIARLRGEQKFAGVDELRDQIERDVQAARSALAATAGSRSVAGGL